MWGGGGKNKYSYFTIFPSVFLCLNIGKKKKKNNYFQV